MNNRATFRINQQFTYYTFLSIFYVVLMVTAQSLAYRMLQIGPFLEPGGIFIFPASFAVSDIIAEVYGPTLARRSIFFGLIAQAFFSAATFLVNYMPYPIWWQNEHAFRIVFEGTWLVFLSNVTAVIAGMILNTQIIGKTKLLTRGKFFSIRSLFSSAVGEFILTAIIVAIALVPVTGLHKGISLFINMFLFKFCFSFLVIIPASFFVVIFKKLDRVDVYEENVSLNPLNIFTNKKAHYRNVVDFATAIKTTKRAT